MEGLSGGWTRLELGSPSWDPVVPNRCTPKGGKLRTIGILGHFGLRRPAGHRAEVRSTLAGLSNYWTTGVAPARLASSKHAASKQHRRALSGPQSKRGPEIEKTNVTTLSGMVFRKFLGYHFFFGRTPTSRNRWPNGILARFGPWALREIPGLGEKQKNTISRCSTFGGQIRSAQNFLPEIVQLFYSPRFGRPDPQGREA